jgi:hypothetical protein
MNYSNTPSSSGSLSSLFSSSNYNPNYNPNNSPIYNPNFNPNFSSSSSSSSSSSPILKEKGINYNFGDYQKFDNFAGLNYVPNYIDIQNDWGPSNNININKQKNVPSSFQEGLLHQYNPYSHQEQNNQFNDISGFSKLPSHFEAGKSRILRSKEERDEIVKKEKNKIFEKWTKKDIKNAEQLTEFAEEWARADRMGRFEENYDPVGWHELGNLVTTRQHDIKWNRNLVAFDQATRWLDKQQELEKHKPANKRKWDGYKLIAADYDLDPETPDNIILLDKNGKIRAIDGYQLASSTK